ncbi:MAG: ribosomal protein S18-alanine N-acetyltransferase [Lachnospiraceae bacterium]|nr:ribosomal protein S18-alanine N-acetyltransferase [Lachnospiraceae bacterium]
MEESDVDQASELESMVFSMPWKSADFLEMVKAPYAHYFVAAERAEGNCDPEDPGRDPKDPYAGDRIIAILGLRELSGEAEITNVAVHPDYRRTGLAKRLLTEALKLSEGMGIRNVTLEVRPSNEAAIGLYESFGFREEGRRPHFYEKPEEDALIMWRRI